MKKQIHIHIHRGRAKDAFRPLDSEGKVVIKKDGFRGIYRVTNGFEVSLDTKSLQEAIKKFESLAGRQYRQRMQNIDAKDEEPSYSKKGLKEIYKGKLIKRNDYNQKWYIQDRPGNQFRCGQTQGFDTLQTAKK